MTIPRRHILVSTAFASMALSACGPSSGVAAPQPPPGGVDKSTAIQLAIQNSTSTTPTTVESAAVAPFGRLEPGVGTVVAKADQFVWSVILDGTFPPASCGGIPAPGQTAQCPPAQHSEQVIIDYRTGHFIMAGTPAHS